MKGERIMKRYQIKMRTSTCVVKEEASSVSELEKKLYRLKKDDHFFYSNVTVWDSVEKDFVYYKGALEYDAELVA